jgi:hypothetical protein
VNKLVVGVVGLVVLVAASPSLVQLAKAAVPLVVVFAIALGALRWLWWYTR